MQPAVQRKAKLRDSRERMAIKERKRKRERGKRREREKERRERERRVREKKRERKESAHQGASRQLSPSISRWMFVHFFHSAPVPSAALPPSRPRSAPSLLLLLLPLAPANRPALPLLPWAGVRTGIDLHTVYGALHRNTSLLLAHASLFLPYSLFPSLSLSLSGYLSLRPTYILVSFFSLWDRVEKPHEGRERAEKESRNSAASACPYSGYRKY